MKRFPFLVFLFLLIPLCSYAGKKPVPHYNSEDAYKIESLYMQKAFTALNVEFVKLLSIPPSDKVQRFQALTIAKQVLDTAFHHYHNISLFINPKTNQPYLHQDPTYLKKWQGHVNQGVFTKIPLQTFDLLAA